MNLSRRFFHSLRQYAALEAQLNRDYSEPILQLADLEVERLVEHGADRAEAVKAVGQVLTQEVQRFPLNFEELQS